MNKMMKYLTCLGINISPRLALVNSHAQEHSTDDYHHRRHSRHADDSCGILCSRLCLYIGACPSGRYHLQRVYNMKLMVF